MTGIRLDFLAVPKKLCLCLHTIALRFRVWVSEEHSNSIANGNDVIRRAGLKCAENAHNFHTVGNDDND